MGRAMPRGTLFVVGGSEARSPDCTVLERFVTLCGGPSARLVFLSTAARSPERRQDEYIEALKGLGVTHLSLFHQDSREEAEDPALLQAVEEADGVFFAGGNQLRLVTIVGGTRLDALIRERFRAGMHVGGSSAGASALSTVMIVKGRPKEAPRMSSVVLSPGLGLLPEVIVDQHFQERERYGRLLAAVLRNPSMLGFGVDEGTAFTVEPTGRVRVFGKGTLTIVDGARLLGSNLLQVGEHAPVSFAGMVLHILAEGWVFDLERRRVEMPPVQRDSAESLEDEPENEALAVDEQS